MDNKPTLRGIKGLLFSNLIAVFALFLFAPLSHAESASPEDTIPPGTVVNAQNWQNYKNYMPVIQQAMLAGLPSLKMPANWSLTIGPYKHIPLPSAYRDDTERYSRQVKLVQLPDGGFITQDYVAGVPFPNAQEPNLGAKLIYDYYYEFRPYRSERTTGGHLVDKYGDVNPTFALQVVTRFRHVSSPDVPSHVLPGSPADAFFAFYTEVQVPEEAKYTTSLVMYPEDNTKDDSIYLFLPSLRRSLRSSSASRCAPYLGADKAYDDLNGFNGIPAQFYYKVVSTSKRIITVVDRNEENPSWSEFEDLNFMWPKASVGERYEVRPVYVVDYYPIPSVLPNYCYTKSTVYIDKDNYQIIADDRYDKAGKLWRGELWHFWKTPLPDQPGSYCYMIYLNADGVLVDVQNEHETLANLIKAKVNGDVPRKYQDLPRYATPGGLDQIMQ